MSQEPNWKPGRREQHLLWISKVIFRWVGVCGCAYEAYRQNSIGMLAFTILGTGADAGRVLATVVRAVLDDSAEIRKEAERETSSPDSSGE